MDPDSELVGQYDVVRIYKSGRVEVSIDTTEVPAGMDPLTGATSKDVVIDSEANLTARIFVPNPANIGEQQKLPVVVHYHGGAFVAFPPSAASMTKFLSLIAAKANAVLVSIAYRLAPKHPLPIAYEDSFAGLKWVLANAEEDEWLKKYGDFNRVFLSGESAGANIAHHVALKAAGMGIKGVAFVHPWFWISEPEDKERKDKESRETVESLWKMLCPNTKGIDHDPLINPLAEGAPSLTSLACEKMLVMVAELDPLRYNGIEYYKAVKNSGWTGKIDFFETEGEGHIFFAFKPTSEKALAFLERFTGFFNEE